jgi:hypothetical protein
MHRREVSVAVKKGATTSVAACVHETNFLILHERRYHEWHLCSLLKSLFICMPVQAQAVSCALTSDGKAKIQKAC